MKILIYTIILIFIFSCTGNLPNNREGNYTPQLNSIGLTKHFEIYYSSVDTINRQAITDSLEANYDRILSDLSVKNMPKVKVHFYADIKDLKEALADIEPNLPDFAIGLAISESEIHILSPNLPQLNFQYMLENTIHEFAHCVSLKLNPNIANNPRWLWETVAIYEANTRPNPSNFKYLLEDNPPSLDLLSRFDNTYIYEVGYYIGEFLVTTYGKDVLNTLIISNGDIKKTLMLNDEEFTKAWYQFVKGNYKLKTL